MRGTAHVSATRISGWVADPDCPSPDVQVRLTLKGKVIQEGVADQPRPDVDQALGAPGALGFQFLALKLAPGEVRQVQVQARTAPDQTWQPVTRAAGRRLVQYQSFDDVVGASNSSEKLRALRLKVLSNRHSTATPLKGLSVLDLGCNEGFFCGEAVRQGAARVVGLDYNRACLERARKRFPTVEYVHGSWWDLPDEKFDVIFFLSAIHYEPNQRALLQKLAGHLTPSGVLVLECGISSLPSKSWEAIRRADGVRRYPSLPMFSEELMKPYAVRGVGPSVMQAGDAMPRRVFHCTLREGMALLVIGPSHSGKSMLSRDLGERNVPTVSTDQLLGGLLRDKRYDWSPVAEVVRRFPARPPVDFGRIGRVVAAKCPKEFVDVLMLEGPFETDLFCVEGDILRHPAIMGELVRRLRERNIRPWLVAPHNEARRLGGGQALPGAGLIGRAITALRAASFG